MIEILDFSSHPMQLGSASSKIRPIKNDFKDGSLRKSLLILAVLNAFCGVASGQSSVTIYGIGCDPFLAPLGVKTTEEIAPVATMFKELRFSGVIENVFFGCVIDAICHMTISGKTVFFGGGLRLDKQSQWGKVFNFEPKENYLGKKVQVYCREDEKESETRCSLEGSSEYYIKLDN